MTTPRPRRPRQDMQAFRPCLWCGLPVLTAETTKGQTLHLDVRQPCYAVAWSDQAALPTACESQAYVVHTCRGTCSGRPGSV
jgi:hypothetical protein